MRQIKFMISAAVAAMLPLQSAAYVTIKSETLRVWFDNITLVADGETITPVTVFENDIQNYSAFNMAFVVPKGIKIAKVKKGRDWVDDINLTARGATTHSIACNMLDDGETIKIICDSSMLDDFYPDDEDGTPMDELFTLGLIAEEGMANGTYTVELWDVKFVLATADASVPATLPILGTFTVTGGTTSVERIEADGDDAATDCYDLLGRKVTGRPEAPGIYIRNGEKIVVK